MEINQKGLELVKEFEGFREEAYQDSGGIWTCGYGSTRHIDGTPVKKGDTMTEQVASDTLFHYLSAAEAAVECATEDADRAYQLNENQFSALVSFVYNVGDGAFESSTMLKLINESKFTEAAEQFVRWNKCKGKVVDGLTRRRLAEKELFLS